VEDIGILVDLAFAMGAALLGGFIAHLVRQPVILGYLVAGILIGPHTPGPVSSVERVQTLANLGVALLMFALGTEFSLEALSRVRRVAVWGGIMQIALTMVLGTLLGLMLGQPLTGSIFLGGIIAVSSSVLILKLLMERGEVESIAGRVALGIGIVQDISMVGLIIILPALGEGTGVGLELAGSAGLALLRGGVFLSAAYLLGARLVPPLLAFVARIGSRELFLLTIVAIAAGTAVLGHVVGISFALGAFVAGLVVSESEFSSQVLDEIIPLRDVFSALFFVSIGMLLDPSFVVSHITDIALLVGAIIIGKFVISMLAVRVFGYSLANAAHVALLLAQIGEFSFVLAGVGLSRGVISRELYSVVLSGALLTLVLNPLLVNNIGVFRAGVGVLVRQLREVVPAQATGAGGWFARLRAMPAPTVPGVQERLDSLKRHVIVCGLGRVGREVARALQRRGFPFVAIDYSAAKVEEARRQGYLAIYGDATNPNVLEQAGLASARMLVITLPDLPSTEQIVRIARGINPRVRIVARTADPRAIAHLKQAGADEVVQPEFEAGLEMVRQALRNYGVSSLETQAITGGRRQEHYGRRGESFEEDSSWS
jgi:CPA2 family monovalent cation:H+ antiporter-2